MHFIFFYSGGGLKIWQASVFGIIPLRCPVDVSFLLFFEVALILPEIFPGCKWADSG